MCIRRCLTLLLIAVFILPAAASAQSGGNLAVVATATGSARNGARLTTLNDGETPMEPGDKRARPLPRQANQWVQYEWAQPVSTRQVAVFWWDHTGTIKLPGAYHLEYWDGSAFKPVNNATGLGLAIEKFNTTTFDEITTTKLRLVMDSADRWNAR